MGCWNGTCLVSNLPIYAGDEVVFFILKRKHDVQTVDGGHYYADDLYEPLLYPIVGEYDDYGCIENVEEDFSLIEEYFENVELTTNKWDKDNNVFRNIERGNYKGYAYAMAHKDIYDALIKGLSGREEWWTKDKGLREHVLESLENKTEQYLNQKQKFKRLGEPGETEEDFLSFFSVPDVVCGRDSNDFFVARYLKTQDEVLRNKLIEMHLMSVVMMHCRKFWFPQTGAGSQDDEVDLYEVIANKMIEKCQQTRQRWED